MRYCVDIDGTICTPTVGRAYEKAQPWNDRISVINIKLAHVCQGCQPTCHLHSDTHSYEK